MSTKLKCVLVLILVVTGCRMHFETNHDAFVAKANDASIENGKRLTFAVCGGCHYDRVVNKFIGRALNDLPKIAGHLYSANLTQSITDGVPPQYSDAELFYLLKTGIARDGRFLPYMMRPMMADADINDIITYLRSNDAAVTAADTTVGKTHINLVGKLGLSIAAKPQPFNKGVARPGENDPLATGRYLVAIIGCYHCHSRGVLRLNYLEPEKTKGYLQGGIKLKDSKGRRLFGPNLTPDKETGIGNFTSANFASAVRDGIAPSGRKLSPPMGRFTSLSVQQVEAIYTYLMSLQPVRHRVKRKIYN